MHATITEKINLKWGNEGHMGRFGWRKGKEEMM